MLLSLRKPKAPISQRAYDEETLVDEPGMDFRSAKKESLKSIGPIFGSKSKRQLTLLDADSALAHEPEAPPTSVDVDNPRKLRLKFSAAKISTHLRLNSTKRALQRQAASLQYISGEGSALKVLIPLFTSVEGIVRLFLGLGWGIATGLICVAKWFSILALGQVVFWGAG
ncbi:hypothetical protein DFH06DRAFT_1342942 [Mycena polygramma]|nr:hypothetical protein DFH06DRAFT_1342942 [Mycena polygramma]